MHVHTAITLILWVLLLVPLLVLAEDLSSFIPENARFRQDSTVQRENRYPSNPAGVQTEIGSYREVKYKFWFNDGSAVFTAAPGNSIHALENWRIGCKRDLMYNTHGCALRFKGLMVIVDSAKPPFISIGQNHYPGSSVMIRINDEPPMTSKGGETVFAPQLAASLIQKLHANPRVVIRYQPWPQQYTTDEAFQVFGFTEAYEYLNWAVQLAAPPRP